MWLMPERYCMRQTMRSGYCHNDVLRSIRFISVSVRKSVFFRRQNYFINWFTLISNDYKSRIIKCLQLLALRSDDSNDTNNVCRNQLRKWFLCYHAFYFSRNKVITERKEDLLSDTIVKYWLSCKKKKLRPFLQHAPIW